MEAQESLSKPGTDEAASFRFYKKKQNRNLRFDAFEVQICCMNVSHHFAASYRFCNYSPL
jgi:hypothetical protein